jgi:hypothetical protein
MNNNDDYFIKIYNSFITIDSSIKLTVNELHIYCYLYTIRTYENKIFTNFDLLNAEIKFYKKQSDNKKEIKSCIDSLKEKQLINVEEKQKSLVISLSYEEKGHVQLTYDKFRTFNTSRDLYIYVAVNKWEKTGGARYSNNNWADLLNITREYAITVIEDACARGIIYKKVGTYTDILIGNRNQKLQEKNTYSIEPFSKEKFKIDENNSEIAFGEVKEISIFQIVECKNIEEHNWKNNKALDENDFVFYLKNQNNKEIKEMCEKRIKRILSKNERFKFVMDDLMNKAKEIIATSTQQEQEKKESKINEKVMAIIKQTDDIVIQVNNELIPYNEYNGKGNDIGKVYYIEKKDISDEVGISGALREDLRCKSNPKVIDIYRKENGQWRERFYIEDDELRIEEQY